MERRRKELRRRRENDETEYEKYKMQKEAGE